MMNLVLRRLLFGFGIKGKFAFDFFSSSSDFVDSDDEFISKDACYCCY